MKRNLTLSAVHCRVELWAGRDTNAFPENNVLLETCQKNLGIGTYIKQKESIVNMKL
jgi:hypothetical protein